MRVSKEQEHGVSEKWDMPKPENIPWLRRRTLRGLHIDPGPKTHLVNKKL